MEPVEFTDHNTLQNSAMEKIFTLNEAYREKTGRRKKFYSLVMGCQMNAHDSEKISGMLVKMGYEETFEETQADFIIYNTCCIRENAELKVYGKLGYLKHYKRQNPNVIIAVCGCMMQQNIVIEKIKKSYQHVDILFGTFNLYKLPEYLLAKLEGSDRIIDVWEEAAEIVENLPSIRKYPFKSAVNIMYGCNNFCSYCIVPYVRGRERSRRMEDIIQEVKELAENGVVEIMLLGQNVNSYGRSSNHINDSEESTESKTSYGNTSESSSAFAELLREVNRVEGIKRIYFMTSHPKDFSAELVSAMKECDKVMPYLHLPIQSGSNRILQKMNRRYTKEKYLDMIALVRKEIPNIMISTDIIVGFPTETEEDFLDTLDVVRKVRYSTAFTFLYSKRTGTPAAVMEDQVPESVAKERFDRLLSVLNPLIYEVNQGQIGSTLQVLVEEQSSHAGLLTGRAENNSLVHFPGDPTLIGQIIPVKIIENKTFYLIGERDCDIK